MNNNSCDVAVIGAGHAGVEAALAAARLGADTVLFTITLDAVANMPCNPSIGGTAKGQLVYEIDALGGEMGRAADIASMQSRTLNTGKGAAVRSKRVQADRRRYSAYMKHVIECEKNIRLIQAEITEIICSEPDADGHRKIEGVVTKIGEKWKCKAVVLATGTFLESEIFVGDRSYPAGPDGLLASKGLSASLSENGIKLMRFKTGTPARVNRRSIDFSVLELQQGEEQAIPYSYRTDEDYLEGIGQEPCHIVYTTSDTHDIIKENLSRSAMYSGKIHGTGPRYCPSIEDKIVRFADKPRHQLFVEPMGYDCEEMYIQGFSTSLPPDVQYRMLRSLGGFENAEIMRYAYAIEYDCCDPTQLFPTLEFKSISGLYGAGQFNGTSGYEEAAAQGLVAGMNSALKLFGKEEVILTRESSYIGTLIDDLTVKGTNEPYRMMTSRSEYRIILRQDNAAERLTPIGYSAGLVSDEQYKLYLEAKKLAQAEIERLSSTHVSPDKANAFLEKNDSTPLNNGCSLADILRRPEITYEALSEIDPLRPILSRRVCRNVEVSVKYEGYIKRQYADAQRQSRLSSKRLPDDIDYLNLKGLRIEAAKKLDAIRPMTVGQASGISGVSPADITVLLIYLGIR